MPSTYTSRNDSIHHAGTHPIHDDRPAIVNIFAPTPRTNPSAAVKLGPMHSCSVRTQFLKNIYIKKAV